MCCFLYTPYSTRYFWFCWIATQNDCRMNFAMSDTLLAGYLKTPWSWACAVDQPIRGLLSDDIRTISQLIGQSELSIGKGGRIIFRKELHMSNGIWHGFLTTIFSNSNEYWAICIFSAIYPRTVGLVRCPNDTDWGFGDSRYSFLKA